MTCTTKIDCTTIPFKFFQQDRQKKGDKNKELMLADICAFRGKFKEAARLYLKAGHEERALSMFTDLRMFDAAQVSQKKNLIQPKIIELGVFGIRRNDRSKIPFKKKSGLGAEYQRTEGCR